MSQIKYRCTACGQEHIGLPDIGFASPVHYENASDQEKAQHFKLTGDTCIMTDDEGNHYFVRGIMLVPIRETNETFGWGVWVSLSEKNFNRYVTLKSDEEIAGEPPYFGWFSNRVPGYPDTTTLKAKVQLQPGNQRPLITLQPTEHPLSKEQHEGITIERAIEIATPYLHPD